MVESACATRWSRLIYIHIHIQYYTYVILLYITQFPDQYYNFTIMFTPTLILMTSARHGPQVYKKSMVLRYRIQYIIAITIVRS